MDIDEIGKQLLKYPNVVGYSKKLRKRIRDGKVEDEMCIQVHVAAKKKENELRMQDIIPKEIDGIPIDVEVKGPYRAMAKIKRKRRRGLTKTDRIRPLVAGISVGNRAITAGTFGKLMEKTTQPEQGTILLGSNSHVLSEEPKNPTSIVKDILQPGRYDGGTMSDLIGSYYWHKQLHPVGGDSGCKISKGVTISLNGLSWLFHRKTRFEAVVEVTNHIDFAVAEMYVDYEVEFFDVEFPPDRFKSVGFGFAGSDQVSLHCRDSYIIDEGYRPHGYLSTEVNIGDILHKTGRTSCYNNAPVIDDSVFARVNFGNYNVDFDDVIQTAHMLDPGDSGSGIFKESM